MDIAAIQGAMGSLKLAFDLTKKFLEMKSLGEVQGIVIALQREIMDAQSSTFAAQSDQAAMAETVRTLKEEIARVKAWEEQKQRYALVKAWPHTGTVTYALKEESKGTEPPHWICAKCYEDSIKSILNPRKTRFGEPAVYCCPRCRTELESMYTEANEIAYATFDKQD